MWTRESQKPLNRFEAPVPVAADPAPVEPQPVTFVQPAPPPAPVAPAPPAKETPVKPSTKPSASRAFTALGMAAALALSGCDKADAASAPPATAAPGQDKPAPAVKVVSARGVQASQSEEVTGTLYPAQGLQRQVRIPQVRPGRGVQVGIGRPVREDRGQVAGEPLLAHCSPAFEGHPDPLAAGDVVHLR